jgi:phospholipase/carboxylesterase
MHQHTKNIIQGGLPAKEASRAMILVHGRGGNAYGMLELATELKLDDFTLLAPQAHLNSWYPYSFMAPKEQNEPGLSTGLTLLSEALKDLEEAGFSREDIYFLGFSQGACLTSEFLARNADRYGGAFILSGGVIGDKTDRSPYKGHFGKTPAFFGISDIDPHVPLERVHETVEIYREMGAVVSERIYAGAPHTIRRDEVDFINETLVGGQRLKVKE